jgi:hypothetical protein
LIGASTKELEGKNFIHIVKDVVICIGNPMELGLKEGSL